MRWLGVVMMAWAFSVDRSHAQGLDYPSKPVRIIVAFAAGGGADLQARMLAQKLSENLKRSFVVENRTGGGGLIGYTYVAKSPPDGYTILAVSPTFTIAPAFHASLPYDPIKDFAPISLGARFPYLLLVHPALPVKSVRELVALARAKPASLDMGVTYGGATHLASAYFASAAKIKVTFVPYKGTSQAMSDTIAGQIQLLVGNVSAALPHVQSGRLRMLAVSSGQRSSVLPALPTLAESGLPGFDVTTWQGWAAPTGTPALIISKLNEEVANAMRAPAIAKLLAEDGGEAVGGPPEQLGSLIASEIPRWRKVVADLGIRLE